MAKHVDIVEYARRSMAQRVKELIEQGADVNETDAAGDCAVLVAAKNNDINIMQLLLTAGADPNVKTAGGITPWGYAKWNKSKEMIKLIEQFVELPTLPRRAKRHVDIVEYARRGMTERVREMIEQGADVDERDANYDCAVLEAAKRNDLETMKLLLDAGARAEVKSGSGITALAWADWNGSEEMKTLLEKCQPP